MISAAAQSQRFLNIPWRKWTLTSHTHRVWGTKTGWKLGVCKYFTLKPSQYNKNKYSNILQDTSGIGKNLRKQRTLLSGSTAESSHASCFTLSNEEFVRRCETKLLSKNHSPSFPLHVHGSFCGNGRPMWLVQLSFRDHLHV